MNRFASSFDVKTNKETERFQTLIKTRQKIPVLIIIQHFLLRPSFIHAG